MSADCVLKVSRLQAHRKKSRRCNVQKWPLHSGPPNPLATEVPDIGEFRCSNKPFAEMGSMKNLNRHRGNSPVHDRLPMQRAL